MITLITILLKYFPFPSPLLFHYPISIGENWTRNSLFFLRQIKTIIKIIYYILLRRKWQPLGITMTVCCSAFKSSEPWGLLTPNIQRYSSPDSVQQSRKPNSFLINLPLFAYYPKTLCTLMHIRSHATRISV